MKNYTILRLLLASLLLYFAWPYIPRAGAPIEMVFWGGWLTLCLLVIGGNLATLLQLTTPPKMEQDEIIGRRRSSY